MKELNQRTASDPTAPRPKKKSVLLLDADSERQLSRATAMRERGVIVDAVHSGAEARGLWKPRSYHLVMIEMSGASADADEFYRHVLDQEPDQKFGFYSPVPPYITAAPPKSKKAQSFAEENIALSRSTPIVGVSKPDPTAVRQAPKRMAMRSGRPTKAALSFSEAVKSAERDQREQS